MSLRPRGLVLIGLLLVTPGLLAGQELRYKFTTGTTTGYTTEQKQAMKATGAGQELDTKFTSTFDFALTVESVEMATGKAKLKYKFDRVRLTLQGSPADDFELDTKADKPFAGNLPPKLGPLFKALVAGEITLTATPRGEVGDVTLPAALKEQFQKLADEGGGLGGLFSEDQLKLILSDPLLPLPEKPVAPGTTWPVKTELKMGQLGTMKIDTTCTYAGKAGANDKIDQKLTLRLDAGAEADVQLAVKSKEAAGTVLFDGAKGRVHEMTTRIVSDVEIEALGILHMTQTWTMKVKP